MSNTWIVVGVFVVMFFAFYGWWTFCNKYVDPFIKRVVHRLAGRADGGSDG